MIVMVVRMMEVGDGHGGGNDDGDEDGDCGGQGKMVVGMAVLRLKGSFFWAEGEGWDL